MKKMMMALLSLVVWTQVGIAQELPKDSIYHLSSQWKNQNGENISLVNFRGTPIIVTMVYTGCNYSCPMTISRVQDIEKEILKRGIKNYKLVLASFDSKRDKPELLKKYMKTRKLNEEHWVFLSSPDEKTARELAVVLGINFKDVGDGDFSHSNVIATLDQNGVIQAKIESLNADILELVKNMKE